jgi:hypothetical protein
MERIIMESINSRSADDFHQSCLMRVLQFPFGHSGNPPRSSQFPVGFF